MEGSVKKILNLIYFWTDGCYANLIFEPFYTVTGSVQGVRSALLDQGFGSVRVFDVNQRYMLYSTSSVTTPTALHVASITAPTDTVAVINSHEPLCFAVYVTG